MSGARRAVRAAEAIAKPKPAAAPDKKARRDNVVELDLSRRGGAVASKTKKRAVAKRANAQTEDAIAVGTITRLDAEGEPVVAYEGALEGAHARSLVDLGASCVGAPVALLFEGGKRDKPVVVGLLRREDRRRSGELEALVDGRRVVLDAEREIVLRCGKASITLTRAGKIILRGTHVVSRSSGANRVQGSQVRIN